MVKKLFKWLLSIVLALLAYLLLWPVPIDPIAWNAPKTAGYQGDFIPNTALENLKLIDLKGHIGPEDVAFGPDGFIYTPTHDGKILKIDPKTSTVSEFSNIGGRVLGIEFGADGTLYAADSYNGLFKVLNDGSTQLLTNKTLDGSPILYADDLDITKSGEIYFSDASTRFGAKEYGSTLSASLLDLMEHRPNGRILKYDPAIRQTSIIADGFSFPNGVALAKSEKFLLFTQTGTYSVHKLWLTGENKGKVEKIMENLPGFPDNINDNPDGSFWIGLVSARVNIVDTLSDKPFARKIVQRLPAFIRPKPVRYGFVIRIDENGKVLETLQDPAGNYALTTGALDLPDGSVVVSSLSEPRLGIMPPK